MNRLINKQFHCIDTGSKCLLSISGALLAILSILSVALVKAINCLIIFINSTKTDNHTIDINMNTIKCTEKGDRFYRYILGHMKIKLIDITTS